jgi:hypothetical protein
MDWHSLGLPAGCADTRESRAGFVQSLCAKFECRAAISMSLLLLRLQLLWWDWQQHVLVWRLLVAAVTHASQPSSVLQNADIDESHHSVALPATLSLLMSAVFPHIAPTLEHCCSMLLFSCCCDGRRDRSGPGGRPGSGQSSSSATGLVVDERMVRWVPYKHANGMAIYYRQTPADEGISQVGGARRECCQEGHMQERVVGWVWAGNCRNVVSCRSLPTAAPVAVPAAAPTT